MKPKSSLAIYENQHGDNETIKLIDLKTFIKVLLGVKNPNKNTNWKNYSSSSKTKSVKFGMSPSDNLRTSNLSVSPLKLKKSIYSKSPIQVKRERAFFGAQKMTSS